MTNKLAFICVSLALVIPSILFAEHSAGLVPCHGPDCQACHIVALGQNIIEWLITAVTFVIVLVIIAGGFQMVTSGGDPGAVTKARGMITNAIVGLVIMLLAWLIIDTVLKMLLDPAERGDRPWSTISCVEQVEYAQGGEQGGVVGGGTGVPGEGALAHADAIAQLQAAGVLVTSTSGAGGVMAQCTSSSGCTSLQGIREQTVAQAINIKKGCPTCTVTIVGATESGHSDGTYSHGSGYKIDVEDNPVLDAYLTQTLKADGARGGQYGGARYRDACGNEYVREGSHWDISVTQGACGL